MCDVNTIITHAAFCVFIYVTCINIFRRKSSRRREEQSQHNERSCTTEVTMATVVVYYFLVKYIIYILCTRKEKRHQEAAGSQPEKTSEWSARRRISRTRATVDPSSPNSKRVCVCYSSLTDTWYRYVSVICIIYCRIYNLYIGIEKYKLPSRLKHRHIIINNHQHPVITPSGTSTRKRNCLSSSNRWRQRHRADYYIKLASDDWEIDVTDIAARRSVSMLRGRGNAANFALLIRFYNTFPERFFAVFF